MQTNREQLIAQNIWSQDDPRDPETDDSAMLELREWIEKQLAPYAKFELVEGYLPREGGQGNAGTSYFRPYIYTGNGNITAQEPIFIGKSIEELDTKGKAICACALMIRNYLR